MDTGKRQFAEYFIAARNDIRRAGEHYRHAQQTVVLCFFGSRSDCRRCRISGGVYEALK